MSKMRRRNHALPKCVHLPTPSQRREVVAPESENESVRRNSQATRLGRPPAQTLPAYNAPGRRRASKCREPGITFLRTMPATTIAAIRATPVTVPLEAPIRHSNGAHWGRFVRTIVEVESADGYVGLGEMGGGGEDASRAFAALADYLRGHDVFRLEALRFAICNPTASLYNNRTQLHAAIEFACLDIMGQKLGVPVHALLGGKLRDTVEFASYLFFRYNDPKSKRGEVRTSEQLTSHARALKRKHGFRVHKLKGGVYPPAYELAAYRALAEAFPDDRFRYDPNSALSLADAIDFGRGIEE